MARTHHSDPGTRYVAGHLLSDYCRGAVDAETVDFFLHRPWIDDLRRKAKDVSPPETLVEAICSSLTDQAAAEEIKNFAITISRWIESPRILAATKKLLESNPPIPLYISAVLHLANHMRIEAAEWQSYIDHLDGRRSDVLRTVMGFYGVSDVPSLRDTLKGTIISPDYVPGRPLYEYLLRIAVE